ncbi:hypothetical protein [Herbiconiux liangxiaofengii]|uniref:hypothetical protein n=1 Tax=Herbiconiux liangxiaofengii TaxID=3342795 RepID=UPI0035B7FE75
MTRYVDHEALISLLNSVADDDRRGHFVHDFISMWETRSQRLMKALGDHDFEDADVVLLSIRSSSTMLGAWPLEAIAGMIHAAVKGFDLQGSLRHLARLNEVGGATCRELLAVLDSMRAGPQPGSPQSLSEAASR